MAGEDLLGSSGGIVGVDDDEDFMGAGVDLAEITVECQKALGRTGGDVSRCVFRSGDHFMMQARLVEFDRGRSGAALRQHRPDHVSLGRHVDQSTTNVIFMSTW